MLVYFIGLFLDHSNSIIIQLPPAVNSGIILISWYFFDQELLNAEGEPMIVAVNEQTSNLTK